MATPPGSRPRAGGKIVASRRKQRLAATPYHRPPQTPSQPKSPNWFTGIVIPSARALASGAGKILSSAIFSDSESSTSEEEDSASEDDADNTYKYGSPYDGVSALNEKKGTSLEMMQHRQEPQFNEPRTETKWIIEQLIMQETFSREECERLTEVLNSRVGDLSTEAGEKGSLVNYSGKTVNHEYVDIFNKAVLEAKKWFQEKKVGSSSVPELAHGTCDLNSTVLEHAESGVGSPVDVARSYMRDKPSWASPTKNVELGTPLTTTMKLFNEGTSYSVSCDALSSSKRWSSLASGSWNIQEELRRVRSKATEDMLRTPPTKIDPSLFAVATTRQGSAGASKVASVMGERMAELETFWKGKPIDPLMDVGVSFDPARQALESTQDGKACEALSSKPAASVSENNEDSEAIQIDGECAPSKSPHITGPNHAGEQHSDPHSTKISGPPTTGVAVFGGRHVNGLSSTQASLSPGVAMVQNNKQYNEESYNEHTFSENKSTNTINVEGNCELLSEANVEVPTVTESDGIASGSQNGLGVQYEESSLEMTQPPTEVKSDLKQQGRKPGKNNRRSRGRGK